MQPTDVLFRLQRPPASSGPLIELYSRRLVASASSTAVGSSVAGVAKDRVLILTNVSIDLDPGATQAVVRCVISGRTPGGVTFAIAQTGFVAVADLRTGFNWAGEVMIGGSGVDNAIVIVDAVYDAGVAANIITINVFGYVVPRGNIAPF